MAVTGLATVAVAEVVLMVARVAPVQGAILAATARQEVVPRAA